VPSIGPMELILVFLIALVVLGPKRLPSVGRQIGRAIREFRSATSQIRSEMGVDDIVSDVRDIRSTLGVDDVAKGLTRDVDDVKQTLRDSADAASAPLGGSGSATGSEPAAKQPVVDDATTGGAPQGGGGEQDVTGDDRSQATDATASDAPSAATDAATRDAAAVTAAVGALFSTTSSTDEPPESAGTPEQPTDPAAD